MAGTGKSLQLAVSAYNLAGSVSAIISHNTPSYNALADLAISSNWADYGSAVVVVKSLQLGTVLRSKESLSAAVPVNIPLGFRIRLSFARAPLALHSACMPVSAL
jgi:hypothetical protein